MQQLMEWSYSDEDGGVVRGWRTEPRGLPVVFFLHGNGLCGMVYWPMLQRLCDEYDVVMLDVPGHGNSDAPERFRGWEANAECCYRAWLSLEGEYRQVKKHAVGHSFGGVLCAITLAKNPEAFDSAVLLDPVFFPPWMLRLGRILHFFGLLKFHRLARITSKRRDQWPNLKEAHDYLLARRMYAQWESSCFDLYEKHGLKKFAGGVQLSCAKTLEASIFGSMPFNLSRHVKSISTPCVIYSGDKSYDYVVKSLPKYCTGHRFIEHKEISGGHNFMLEKTEQSANWVREALQTLSP